MLYIIVVLCEKNILLKILHHKSLYFIRSQTLHAQHITCSKACVNSFHTNLGNVKEGL